MVTSPGSMTYMNRTASGGRLASVLGTLLDAAYY